MTYAQKLIEDLFAMAQPRIDDYARRMSLRILPPDEPDDVLPLSYKTDTHEHTVLDLIAFDDDGSGPDAWRTGPFHKISLICRIDHEYVEGWFFTLVSGWTSNPEELKRLIKLQIANDALNGVAHLTLPRLVGGEYEAVLETGLDDIIVKSSTEFGVTLEAGEIAANLGLVIIDKDEGECYE